MGSVTANRWLALGALLLVSGLLIGCTTGGVRAPNAPPALTPDGLVSSPTPSGLLFIRPDHNIGGYDQVFFEPIYISYRDGRKALGAKDQAALLTALERGERERAEQAGIAIASMRSPCVMSMRFSIVDLDLNEVGSTNMSQTIFVASMGTVTLVVDIWDSKSGKALLRFAQRRKILGGNTLGPPHAAAISRLKKTLDTMLADFGKQLLTVISRTRLQPPVSPECKGLLRTVGDEPGPRLLLV